MRVIGGSAGGFRLKGPPRSGVRPTADRVREAIFEVLAAHDLPMKKVLDLYSGTGALGIEALSRGAELCHFVESDPRACEVIRENLTRTRFLDRAKVFPLPVARALGRLPAEYDLVVADPPYEYDRAQQEIAAVAQQGLLEPGGAIVVEHSRRHDWPQMLDGLQRIFSRRYGDSSVSIYH
jgi:16S rRNA (guanine966-N2)-methyltransferase